MGITDSLKQGWDSFSDYAKQNLGITEKAVLEIIDLRDRPIEENPATRVVVGQASDNLLVNGPGGKDMETQMRAGMVQDLQDNVTDERNLEANAKLPLKQQKKPEDVRIKRGEQVNRYTNAKAKYFTVQFNPNTLRLSGHSGGLVRKTAYNAESRGNAGKLDYGPGKTYIELAVSLLFDKVDAQDAFLGDKFAPSISSMATGAAKLGMSIAGKKKNTVQPEVEALIAALRNENTRLITFFWGKFSYPGILKSVNANYVMFNVSGEPIRATVDLSITCADSEIMPRSLYMWKDLYIKAYSDEARDGGKSYVKASQKVGGLLNI